MHHLKHKRTLLWCSLAGELCRSKSVVSKFDICKKHNTDLLITQHSTLHIFLGIFNSHLKLTSRRPFWYHQNIDFLIKSPYFKNFHKKTNFSKRTQNERTQCQRVTLKFSSTEDEISSGHWNIYNAHRIFIIHCIHCILYMETNRIERDVYSKSSSHSLSLHSGKTLMLAGWRDW